MGTINLTDEVVTQSLHERLDARKGLRDATKELVVEPARAFRQANQNRLVCGAKFTLDYKNEFDSINELMEYARYVAGDNAPSFTHMRQLWTYHSNAPTFVKMFIEGLADEGAMRYAGAEVTEVEVYSGSNRQWVTLRDHEGKPITRAQWLMARVGPLVKQYRANVAEGGAKLSRKDLDNMVKSHAETLVTEETSAQGAERRARETAVKTIESIVKGADQQVRPESDLSKEETKRLVTEVAERLGMVAMPAQDAMEKDAKLQSAMSMANLFAVLHQIASTGSVPKDLSDSDAKTLLVVAEKAQKVLVSYINGDLVPGQVMPGYKAPKLASVAVSQ